MEKRDRKFWCPHCNKRGMTSPCQHCGFMAKKDWHEVDVEDEVCVEFPESVSVCARRGRK